MERQSDGALIHASVAVASPVLAVLGVVEVSFAVRGRDCLQNKGLNFGFDFHWLVFFKFCTFLP